MGPFIAIAGVVVTFLAFLMQKKANDILSSQYDEDKKADKEDKPMKVNDHLMDATRYFVKTMYIVEKNMRRLRT